MVNEFEARVPIQRYITTFIRRYNSETSTFGTNTNNNRLVHIFSVFRSPQSSFENNIFNTLSAAELLSTCTIFFFRKPIYILHYLSGELLWFQANETLL